MSVDLSEPRPSPSAELMEILAERYGLNLSAAPRDLGGSYSLNLLIDTSPDRYVARVHGSQTGPARLESIQRARRFLAGHGIPAPEQIVARDGNPFVTLGTHLVEVERYVEHDADMDTWPRLEAGLPYLGRIHSLFRSFPAGPAGRRAPLANHIEPHQVLEGTLRGVARMHSWDLSDEECDLAASYEELARLVHAAEQCLAPTLPRQLVHGDFWDNNVLFKDEEVALVTDLDFMGERLRIDDLALTLFFANSSLGGERLSDQRIGQLRALVDAYDSGLADHLSSAERLALPPAIARQTLWTIGWWVWVVPEDENARFLARFRRMDAGWTMGLMRDLKHWQDAFAP